MTDKQLKILIVEDDYLVKTEIERTLKQLGHLVVGEASNGKEGIEKTIEHEKSISHFSTCPFYRLYQCSSYSSQ